MATLSGLKWRQNGRSDGDGVRRVSGAVRCSLYLQQDSDKKARKRRTQTPANGQIQSFGERLDNECEKIRRQSEESSSNSADSSVVYHKGV